MKTCIRRFLQLLAVSCTLGALAGCGTVDTTSATAFGSAATATGQQADTAFAQVNSIASQSVIANAAQQPGLSEANFLEVLPPSSVSQWDNTFSAMAAYAQALNALSASGNAEGGANAVGGLATEIQAHTNSQTLPGLSAAFVAIAGAVEKAKDDHDARQVAQTVDPQVQAIVLSMANAIGSSSQTGIRGTVYGNYATSVLAPLQMSFSTASAQDKVSLAKQFAAALDQRNAADLQLVSLRSSILALGTAHHALVTKSSDDFATALATINQQLALAQKAYSDVKAAPPVN